MGATEQDPLSIAELSAQLQARGVELSPAQLKRLRREGLLSCEGQEQLRGLRGSVSLYPAYSVDQVHLVHKLGLRERRFAQRRILVRWHEGWVDPSRLRESLTGILEGVSTKVNDLAAGPGDKLDAADRVVKQLDGAQGNLPVNRLMRERLGGKNVDQLAFAFVAIGLGGASELEWDNRDPNSDEPSLLSVFEQAVGLDRARQDQIAGQPSILSPDQPTPVLIEEITATGSMDLADPARAFRDASDAEIDQGFADAHTFASLILFAEAAQAMQGKDVGGLASLEVLLEDNYDTLGITLLVRQAILIRPQLPEGRLEGIEQALKDAAPQFEAVLRHVEAALTS
jgi:hypothetical protein